MPLIQGFTLRRHVYRLFVNVLAAQLQQQLDVLIAARLRFSPECGVHLGQSVLNHLTGNSGGSVQQAGNLLPSAQCHSV